MHFQGSHYYHRYHLSPIALLFSSPCSSHTGLITPVKTYQKSLHTTFAPAICWAYWPPALCIFSSLKLQLWWDLLFAEDIPGHSASSTPSVTLNHIISLSPPWTYHLVIHVFACPLHGSPQLEDKLQEGKTHLSTSTSAQYLAHNTHLINICWIAKQKT